MPNPFSGPLFLRLDGNEAKRIRTSWKEGTGRMLGWDQLEIQPGLNPVTIPNGFPAGMYFLEIEANSEKPVRFRIIKE